MILSIYFFLVKSPLIFFFFFNNFFNILSFDNALTNYWPMDNHVNDTVGAANMYNGYNVQFTKDRFGNENSAIRFSNGFYQVPSGFYYNGDFTISVWIKPIKSFYNAPIFDFGNGGSTDSIRFISTTYSYYSQSFYIFFKNYESRLDTSYNLVLGQWTHFVFTLSDTVGSLYINGLLTNQNENMFSPRNLNRTSNYIGKSSGYSNFLWADLDDLKIYNRSMSSAEVNYLYLQQMKTGSSNSLGYIKRFINRFVKFNV